MTDEMVAEIRSFDGIITREDFETYRFVHITSTNFR